MAIAHSSVNFDQNVLNLMGVEDADRRMAEWCLNFQKAKRRESYQTSQMLFLTMAQLAYGSSTKPDVSKSGTAWNLFIYHLVAQI